MVSLSTHLKLKYCSAAVMVITRELGVLLHGNVYASWIDIYVGVARLPELFQVTVINTDRGLSCSASGDPHYHTFDGA